MLLFFVHFAATLELLRTESRRGDSTPKRLFGGLRYTAIVPLLCFG